MSNSKFYFERFFSVKLNNFSTIRILSMRRKRLWRSFYKLICVEIYILALSSCISLNERRKLSCYLYNLMNYQDFNFWGLLHTIWVRLGVGLTLLTDSQWRRLNFSGPTMTSIFFPKLTRKERLRR